MAMEADEAQIQAVHCFASTFRHPTTNDTRSGILRVNSFNQSLELFTIEGLVLSISASNIICFQFDVRNPEMQFTIYRRSQIPIDIQTTSSDDSDQICVLLDALIASRPIAPNCKFLRSGQADLCGRTVTLILLGNAHIIFADGSIPILLLNLAHTKISLSRKTGITLTLLKGPEQDYLLDMKTERERQEWVVAFNRAMAIRKAPTGRSVAQHRASTVLASPGAIRSQRGSFQLSTAAGPAEMTKKDSMVERHQSVTKKQEIYIKDEDEDLGRNSVASVATAMSPKRRESLVKEDDDDDKADPNQGVSLLKAGHSFKRLSMDEDKTETRSNPSGFVAPRSNPIAITADKKSEPVHSRRRSVKDLQKRESFSKQIEIEPEPEPLRSPSFAAPISIQMKSIRSSYAVARSLASGTTLKRASSVSSDALQNRRSEADDPANTRAVPKKATAAAVPAEPSAAIAAVGNTDQGGKASVTACVVVSIETDGTLRAMPSATSCLQITSRCAEAAAITVDGAILQWSFSDDGSVTGPVTIPHPDHVQFDRLSCGRDHHLAVSSPPSSQLYGWGRCSLLGMKGTAKTVTSTTLIPALADVRIKAVASAAKHTFAVTAQDEIWTWGGTGPWLGRDQTRHHFTPAPLTTRLPASVLLVACSTETSYVVTTTGRVYACGTGRHGRLGLGDCLDRAELAEVSIPAEIMDVVPGGRHALARSRSGQIYAWGCNAFGQLGISASVKMSMSPVLVPALTSCAVVKIACAKTATMALTRSADVLMCGSLTGGQVLDSPTILELDPTLCGRVHDIVCGYQIALIMSEPPSTASTTSPSP